MVGPVLAFVLAGVSMATIYGPQTWPDTFNYPSYYQSSDHGGVGTPNADYPELAAAENARVVVGTGPNGENVVDAVDTGDYTTAGIALLELGPLAGGQYDARGLTVEWDHFFKISGLAENDHGQLLALATGLFGANTFLVLDAEGTGGTGFNYEIHYRRFTGTSPISGTAVNPAANLGSGTADNAWHHMKVVLRPSTVTGAFSGAGTLGSAVVSSDGAISLYRDDVLLGTISGLNFVINYLATSNPEVYYAGGLWHGFSDLLGPVTNTYLYNGGLPGQSPSIPTDDSIGCCGTDGVEGSGVSAPGAGVDTKPAVPGWTMRCAGGGTVPLAPSQDDGERWG